MTVNSTKLNTYLLKKANRNTVYLVQKGEFRNAIVEILVLNDIS